MISPPRLTTADPASGGARSPVKTTKPSPDSCLVRPRPGKEAGKEKDPGSAFGPESVPLATGLVPVVYWVPGPFPGPTPRPARWARQALLARPVPRLAQGRLA